MVKKKTVGAGKAKAVVFGLAGLTAAAVGAYYLYGSKDAAKNRAKVKGWTLKAKGEVLEALEKAKSITPEEYNELVETAVKAYGTVKEATKGEIKDFKSEMLEHWNKLEKNKAVKKMVSGAKGTAKAAKKVVK